MKTNKNILKNCIGAVSIIMLPALFTACSSSDEGYVGEGEKALAPTVTASIDDDDVTMTSAIVKVEGIANADSVKYIFTNKGGDKMYDMEGNELETTATGSLTSTEFIRSNGIKADISKGGDITFNYNGLKKGSDYTFNIVAYGKRYSSRRATIDFSTITYGRLDLAEVFENKVSATNSVVTLTGALGTLTLDCYYDSSETMPAGTYKISAKAAKSGCYITTKKSKFVMGSGEEGTTLKVKSGTLTVTTSEENGTYTFEVTAIFGDNNEYRGTFTGNITAPTPAE